MKHLATPEFWFHYRNLPEAVRQLADKNFELLKSDPHHPSLRLKKVGGYYSARVGIHYRALAKSSSEGLLWLWIGHHAEYDRFLS